MKLNKKKFIKAISLLLFLLLILIVLIVFTVNKMINKNDSKSYEKMNLNFKDRVDTLNEFKSDYLKVGWIQVQGTNIDCPVLEAKASIYELNYSYAWRSSTYSTGENREVILGHNIINVSSTPMLSNDNLMNFESLMSFTYASFAKDNLYIKYTKDNKEEIYLIYAVGFYDYGYDNAESFNNKEKIKNYINDVRKNSIYDYDVDVNENDQIITLKTCTRYFGYNEKQQLFVDARKLRDNEEILKYSVKTNSNFDEIMNSSKID